jgi:hypothetical protein
MLADVWLDPAPLEPSSLLIAEDPGARVSVTGTDELGRMGYRLRGLAPGSELELQVEIGDDSHTQLLHTEEPLKGFTPWFGTTITGEHYEGLRLFDLSAWPLIGSGGAYVIDAEGVTRFYLPLDPSTEMSHAALPAGLQLLDDGSLLFLQDDALQILDEWGRHQLRIDAANLGLFEFHHDVLVLPSGNFLALSRSYRDLESSTGDLETYCSDLIVEFSPLGEILWTWDSFDHLDPTRERSGTDISEYPVFHPETGEEVVDWTHGNALVYRAEDDSILLSLRHQDWLVSIDHATGDVLWRLGEEGDFELDEGSWFYHQHAPEWQEDGSLLLYDNGVDAPGLEQTEWRSRAVRYALDTESWRATEVWTEDDQGFNSMVAGDADTLPNGNVQIVDATLEFSSEQFFPTESRIREVDPESGEWTWVLKGPDFHFIFRAMAIDRLPGESG